MNIKGIKQKKYVILTEKRVREIVKEEILKREIEKIINIAKIDALAKKLSMRKRS